MKIREIKHKRQLLIFFLFIALIIFGGCGKTHENTGSEKSYIPAFPKQITLGNLGDNGIFDPNIGKDPGSNRLWMSFSIVDDSAMWPESNLSIYSSLAYSDDYGSTWQLSGVSLNNAQDLNLPAPSPNHRGTWVKEVSCIVYDKGESDEQKKWKALWHTYLEMNGVRTFEHGWVSFKTAPTAAGPWSSEKRLFVGSIYDHNNDSDGLGAGIALDTTIPELSGCLTFTEPGFLSVTGNLYVCLFAPESSGGRIILLRLDRTDATYSSWDYLGTFIQSSQAVVHGYDGFGAPDFYTKNSTHYLLTTLTSQAVPSYRGMMVFEIESLATASLKEDAGEPDPVYTYFGTSGTHNGCGGYHVSANNCGIIYSEVDMDEQFFRIYASGVNPQ